MNEKRALVSFDSSRIENSAQAEEEFRSIRAEYESLKVLADELVARKSKSWDSYRLWFGQIADYISDPVFLKDRASRFVMANESLLSHFSGGNTDNIIGKSDIELHTPEFAYGFFREEQKLMTSNDALVAHEQYVNLPNGDTQWLSMTKIPLSDEHGTTIGLFGIGRDITRRKTSELLRERQSKVLEMIAAGEPLAFVLKELLLLIEQHIRGVKASIMLLNPDGTKLHHGAAPSLPENFCSAMDGLLIGPQSGSCGVAAFKGEDVVVADIAASPLWAGYKRHALETGLRSCASTPIKALTGRVLGTVGIYTEEVSKPNELQQALIYETARIAGIAIERDQAQSKIRFFAENDPLTELPNRNMLEGRITELVKADISETQKFSLVFVDLDRFKNVNDSLGHSVGDKVLQIIAERLNNCVRPGDFVSRFGGDEFVILMEKGAVAPEQIKPVLERIQAAISEPIELESQSFEICSSLGISLYPQDGKDAEALLKHADDAMYEAKALGRNCYRFYSSKLADDDAAKLMLLQDIRIGIRKQQFFLEYQPQYDLNTGEITGVEALVRWMHPEKGRVPPGKFIMAAEESGLISDLGKFVLHEACQQGSLWQAKGSNQLVVSVNVSAHQFLSGDLVENVTKVLDETGFDPNQLELELTESSLVKDPDHCIQTMNTLREQGVRIALDDFGTGYSSLSTLSAFPLNKLKIDRSFVQNMENSTSGIGVARAIIALGQELEMRVIAEGVETENQLEQLKALNCNDVQGFLTGRPMDAGKIEGLLSSQNAGSLH
ncbi:MAG: EAL domain-containing protein [Roseibium sp.]